MVISNSNPSWVRPAPAIIYTDSGEAIPFPPLGCGGLPRALTFLDWPVGPKAEESEKRCQIIHKTDDVEAEDNAFSPACYSEPEDQFSVLVTSHTSKDEIEDPPEAYESFEVDCTQQSFSKSSEDMYVDFGVPCMSTPTECYSSKLKQMQPHEYKVQPQSALPSGSCCPNSPLFQDSTNAYLCLDELVDLYTEQMDAARKAKDNDDKNDDDELAKDDEKASDECNMEPSVAETDENCLRPNDEDANMEEQRICTKDINSISSERNLSSPKTQMQLMVFDIQKLLQKLDDIFEPDENSRDGDTMFISLGELESLLSSCCTDSDCEPPRQEP